MEALQTRISARMERAMAANIAAEYHNAAKQVESYLPLKIDGEKTGRVLLAGWDAAATTFGGRMIDQIGKRHNSMERKALLSNVFKAAFLEFSRRWIATKVTQIDTTTEEHIRELILEGEYLGAGVESIAKMIRDKALPASRLRSHVIARTETHFAAGWANQTAAEEAGIELHKEWCSGGDSRVRETHLDADGQRVPLNMPFTVGGYPLMYPGDASGPAEEVIMCRCQSLYVEP